MSIRLLVRTKFEIDDYMNNMHNGRYIVVEIRTSLHFLYNVMCGMFATFDCISVNVIKYDKQISIRATSTCRHTSRAIYRIFRCNKGDEWQQVKLTYIELSLS